MKGRIYDLVHLEIVQARIKARTVYEVTRSIEKYSYHIASVEIPLAQKIIKLLEGKSKNEKDRAS